jgi:hypothetical protein
MELNMSGGWFLPILHFFHYLSMVIPTLHQLDKSKTNFAKVTIKELQEK